MRTARMLHPVWSVIIHSLITKLPHGLHYWLPPILISSTVRLCTGCNAAVFLIRCDRSFPLLAYFKTVFNHGQLHCGRCTYGNRKLLLLIYCFGTDRFSGIVPQGRLNRCTCSWMCTRPSTISRNSCHTRLGSWQRPASMQSRSVLFSQNSIYNSTCHVRWEFETWTQVSQLPLNLPPPFVLKQPVRTAAASFYQPNGLPVTIIHDIPLLADRWDRQRRQLFIGMHDSSHCLHRLLLENSVESAIHMLRNHKKTIGCHSQKQADLKLIFILCITKLLMSDLKYL